MRGTDQQVDEMRQLWDGLSRKSRLGFIAHLQDGADWDVREFHLAGIRIVDRMVERIQAYGRVEPSRADLLEIGCGIGRFAKPLACRFKHVWGVDISKEMIEAAQEYCCCMPNLTLLLNDGQSLGAFEDDSLDYCVSAGVFQHITDMAVVIAYIREALRILKEGGLLMFQFDGTRTEAVGRGQNGTKITAKGLTAGLAGAPYAIREVSIDPDDPVGNVVIVIGKTGAAETVADADQRFETFEANDRHWVKGVYDDIKTRAQIHLTLQSDGKRLTFYD